MAAIAIRVASRLKTPGACGTANTILATSLCCAAPATALNNNVIKNITAFQHANITSAGGKPRQRKYKPFDYRKKSFTLFHQPFDRTLRRLDENSKVIVIDGPIASGKSEFAEKLAHELDFKFVPQPSVNSLYIMGGDGLNYQDLDELLDPEHRLYDLESFLKDPAPTLAEGNLRAGELQLDYFTARLYAYNDALLHMLSTGNT